MPLNVLRLIFTLGLLVLCRLAQAQMDLSLAVQVSADAVAANTPSEGRIVIRNEGQELATGIQVQVRLSASLFFLKSEPSHGTFSAGTLIWSLERLAAGARQCRRGGPNVNRRPEPTVG